uniref:Disease resistance R13L4/SHOC-2-like LRR domain-containing protein n=1 Tax=Myripristis murdjan TaxID=586833 RepID=A0A668A7A9_9TELE
MCIEVLNLGNNSLQELPEGLGSSLNNLRSSSSAGISSRLFLVCLSEDVGQLKGLKKLCISHNKIQYLPSQIGALQFLEELDISFNDLRDLPRSFSNLKRLRTLDADHNKLNQFPPEILALGDLEELDCTGNKFEALQEIYEAAVHQNLLAQ